MLGGEEGGYKSEMGFQSSWCKKQWETGLRVQDEIVNRPPFALFYWLLMKCIGEGGDYFYETDELRRKE